MAKRQRCSRCGLRWYPTAKAAASASFAASSPTPPPVFRCEHGPGWHYREMHRVSTKTRRRMVALAQRDFGVGGRPFCYLCGRVLRDPLHLPDWFPRPLPDDWPEIEHVHPLALGAPQKSRLNQRLSCALCNRRKADRTLGELLDPDSPWFDPHWPVSFDVRERHAT